MLSFIGLIVCLFVFLPCESEREYSYGFMAGRAKRRYPSHY
jgi:hypothetical protein